jgi:uncharacterized protein
LADQRFAIAAEWVGLDGLRVLLFAPDTLSYNCRISTSIAAMIVQSHDQPMIPVATEYGEAMTGLSIVELLPQITDRLVQLFDPETVLLFGSHAWGTPHADSDLDLLVIVSASDLSSSKRSTLAYRNLRDIPYPLDILVKTRQEIAKFSQVVSSLEYQILSKGKCLYGQ